MAALVCGCQALAPVAPPQLDALAETELVSADAQEAVALAPSEAPAPPQSDTEPAMLERTPEDGGQTPLAQVLAQAERLAAAPAPELARAISRLEGLGALNTSQGQLQMATLLALTRVPSDTARALGLVQRVLNARNDEAQTLRPLARLLESLYLQQRRLEEQVDRQGHQLREAQRKSEQLSERLDAVLAIERSLTSRRGVQPPRPLNPAP